MTNPQTSETGEVRVIPDQSVVARDRVAQLVTYLRNRAEITEQSRGYDIAAMQISKIMDAVENGTDDDIWMADQGGVVSGQDIAGVELNVTSFDVSPSSDQFDAPLEHFISIHATVLSSDPRFQIGEEVVVNTGAPLVIMKCRALEARSMLPAAAVIVKTPSRKGNVLRLMEAPKHAVAAS